VIRGEKYSEKADVYSFGVVMWEVATRKQPFAGRNFMGVSLDVLEGKRPKVPSDLPPAFKKLLKRYGHLHSIPRKHEALIGVWVLIIATNSGPGRGMPKQTRGPRWRRS
jgi:serine/threonine protein kinase